jgi:glutaminyl-peptide cyclotransferase
VLVALVLVACGAPRADDSSIASSSTLAPSETATGDSSAAPAATTSAQTDRTASAAPPDSSTSASTATATGPGAVVPTVVETHPHDTAAFTQGLVLASDALFESTGGYGESTLREVDLASGSVRREVRLPDDLFGEGLAMVGDRLIQLTWREGRALVYDAGSFEAVEELTYEGEGWGLCHDGEALWMSDGSSMLTRRDPITFEALAVVPVTRSGQPVERLNELECVGGLVYANVWLTDDIVVVDPGTGEVVLVVDGSRLLEPDVVSGLPDEAVLNGIAHDPTDDTFLLTGKLWPSLLRVHIPRE